MTKPVPIRPKQIRLAWSIEGRKNSERKPIDGGLWFPDTQKFRRDLQIVADAGNEVYGPGTHWIEQKQE